MNEPTNYVLSHLNNYENYVMFHLNLCLSFRTEKKKKKKTVFHSVPSFWSFKVSAIWYRFSPVCFWVLQKFSRSHFTLKYHFLFQYVSLNQLSDKEAMRTHQGENRQLNIAWEHFLSMFSSQTRTYNDGRRFAPDYSGHCIVTSFSQMQQRRVQASNLEGAHQKFTILKIPKISGTRESHH